MTFSTQFSTTVGSLTLEGDDRALTRVGFDASRAPQGDAKAVAAAAIQLEQYFAGERTEFDLHVELDGTEFERRVWDEVRAIPYGQTATYAEIARRIGRPGASRAVGRANGRNPLAVIVPCHRVVGSDGSLTGYAGGIAMKRALLDLEQGQRRVA
jgi:methylated-DNA-[protein]-cysteine S-methyltransferase